MTIISKPKIFGNMHNSTQNCEERFTFKPNLENRTHMWQ